MARFNSPHAAWYHHTANDLIAEHGDPTLAQIVDAVEAKFWELNTYSDDAWAESEDARFIVECKLDVLIGRLLD